MFSTGIFFEDTSGKKKSVKVFPKNMNMMVIPKAERYRSGQSIAIFRSSINLAGPGKKKLVAMRGKEAYNFFESFKDDKK